MRARNRRRRRDNGAVAVEFALILPILVLIIFAIVDFGRLLNAQLVVKEASREGARAAALVDAAAAEQRVKDTATSLDSEMIDINVAEECDETPTPTETTTVTVTYTFEFVTPIMLALGLGDDEGQLAVTSTSVMPCLQ